ncbi:HEPN domain-containing protein [Candidatus Woesearchaeota archaeon]|nr:HEPN domain-containing protein [Candidatus Woesearchaeota archaeon]
MRPEAETWWNNAEDDYETARITFKAKRYSISAFCAQQAAEKALKAVLIDHTKELIKTHDLTLLARKLDAKTILDACARLSSAYIATRYPDVAQSYDPDKVSSLLELAKEVLSWAKKALSGN